MDFLRQNLTVRVFSLVMALAIFNLSCSKDAHLKAPCRGNLNIELKNLTSTNIASAFENYSYLVTSVVKDKKIENYGGLYTYFYGNSPEALSNVQTFEDESQKYVELGFDGYFLDMQNRGHVSELLKDQLIAFKNDLTVYINSSHPDVDQYVSFIDNYKNNFNTNLCSEELEFLNNIFEVIKGHGQYFYEKYYDSESELKNCTFWQGVLCASLALIVTVTISTIFFFLSFIGNVTYTDPDGNVIYAEEGSSQGFITLIGFAIGIYAGIKMYDWCCSWFEEGEDLQDSCERPTGHFYKLLDCDEYEYRIFGPSEYGNTEWLNNNTDPEVATTPTPILRFTVPDQGNESQINATVSCRSDEGIDLFAYNQAITLVSATDDFNLAWQTAPPSNHVLEQFVTPEGELFTMNSTVQVSVNVPYNGQYNYNWSINSPYVISGSTTSSSAALVFTGPGTAVTNVTVENVCTGEVQSLSATTTIQ